MGIGGKGKERMEEGQGKEGQAEMERRGWEGKGGEEKTDLVHPTF